MIIAIVIIAAILFFGMRKKPVKHDDLDWIDRIEDYHAFMDD